MDRIKALVTDVIDGDTFDVKIISSIMNYKTYERIRINGCDAPETGTRGAANSKLKLIKQILRKQVSLKVHARDVYGRLICDVEVIK